MKSFLPLLHFFLVLTLMVPAAFVGEPAQAADALTLQDARPMVQAGDAPSHASDRILIKFASGVAPRATVQGALATGHASLDGLLSAYQVQAAHRLFKSVPDSDPAGLTQIHVLRLKPGTDLDTLLALLETDPNVEWAEPDYLAFAAATTPNDPLFADQWGLAKIQAPAAWDVTTGSAILPIAIVDSGIDFTHSDLSGKLWVNPGEIAGNGLDDDNNGYVDDVQGWDLVNADNLPADDNGHGTQVAGIAAASTNNSAGIAGVCWACKIMPVKVMQASGVANYSDIAAGVLYAAQKGARVINLSLGGYSYSSALDAAIQAASGTYGAVIVAGAGNDNLSTPFYPAAYPEVLAVAGTDPADTKAALSNYGAWVDVSAPAVGIKTTFMGGDYGDVDGTSYAAPFVAGVAGLLRSQNPDWSPDMVRAQIIHTADDIDPLNPGLEGQLGSGRVNALTAVTQTPSPIVEIAATAVNGDPLGRPAPGESATLQITLSNDWLDAVGTVGTLTTSDPNVTISQGSATFGTITAGATATGSPVYAFTVSASAGYNHPIPFNLHMTANGGAYAITLPLTITTASANQHFCGTIDSNETWTSDKTYIITCNAGIAPGYTLTIQPGTVVKFDGNYSLNVGGALIADGTEEQPIRFMSDTGSPWGRIYFDDSSIDATADASGTYQTGNLLRWVIVEGAAQGIAVCANIDETTLLKNLRYNMMSRGE